MVAKEITMLESLIINVRRRMDACCVYERSEDQNEERRYWQNLNSITRYTDENSLHKVGTHFKQIPAAIAVKGTAT